MTKAASSSRTQLARKTLIISQGMPPALNGSTFVIRNLASQFSENEIAVAGEMWRTSRAQGSDPAPENFFYVWKQPDINRVGVINWLRRLWAPIILLRLLRLVRKHQFEIIVGVYPNEYYLTMSWLVSRLTGRPFFSYFHNTFADNRQGLSRQRAKLTQSLVFRASQVVFTMSDGMSRFLTARYPGVHFEPLVHCHQIPECTDPYNPEIDEQTLKIAFLGNANRSNWDAFERFWRVAQHENLVLTIMSSTPSEVFAQHGIQGDKVRFEKVPFREELAALKQQDVLFLPHGFEGGLSKVEYETIFPTKTISYLLSDRPLFAHSPSHSFLTQWLKENECALVVEQANETEIRNGLSELRENADLRQQLVENGRKAVQMFSATRVADFFAQTLNKFVA